MRLEILALRSEPTIGTNEEEIIRDERIQRRNIGGKLRVPEASLELHHFWVGRPNEDRGQQRQVRGH